MFDRPVWAEIDLGAIKRNVKGLKALVGPSVRMCAVVKADGYGHGAVATARAVLDAGADSLAVALVSEGAELRRAGFLCPILVMGCPPHELAREAAGYRLHITVVSPEHARAFSDAGVENGHRAKVHLKIDTGLGRIGTRFSEAPEAAAAGRVCMDMCMADATGLGAKIDDVVDIYGGSGPSLDEIAAMEGTINYEVACNLGKRIPRHYRE